MSMKKTFLSAILSFLAIAGSASAQASHLTFSEAKAASPQCSAGVVYDDGVFSDGYSLGNGDPNDAIVVMKFNLPAGTVHLDQVCTCFARSATGPTSMNFDVVIYDDNGPGGTPGTLLGSVPATINSFPGVDTPAFYSLNVSGSGITLPDTSVYVGARWPGGQIVMCGDTSASTTQRQSFGSGNNGLSWTDMTTMFSSAPPRAMGIRVDPATVSGPSTCVPDATTLCLNGGRFEVKASFQTNDGLSGSAQVVKLTDETGYFWFFGATNVEAVLMVLNGCPVISRYWVFAGGLTNVRTVITVKDSQNGTTKTYINPQNTAFQPIQDTSALATCP